MDDHDEQKRREQNLIVRSGKSEVEVPSTRRATLSDSTFLVAAARAWNSLPLETWACSSLLTFRRETKSHIFRQSDVAPSTPMVSRCLH